MWLVEAYAEEMGRIDARESLNQVNVLQIGTGNMKRARAQTIISAWTRLARGQATRRPESREAWQARIAGAGIGLVMVDGDGKPQ